MANQAFQNTFRNVLKEALDLEGMTSEKPQASSLEADMARGASGEGSDSDAWAKSLDAGSKPEDFNSADNPSHQISSQNIEVAKTWVAKIDEFRKFINGIEPNSLHSQINKMDREGSVFRGIVKSEQKKIIKIAEALASFTEILRSYIISADKKTRDLNAQSSKA